MTRPCLAALALAALCSGGAAAAQATYDETAPPPPAAAAPADDGGTRDYPSASLGFKLELLSLPLTTYGRGGSSGLAAFSYPVLLEGALDIHPRFTIFVGFGTYLEFEKAENDEDAEDEAKERLDHLLWGLGVGVEYLVVAEFGVGAEFGFRWSYNNLEDTEEDLDGLYTGQFSTFFGLKLAYHF